ncbi:MAG: hypothetical protein GY821_08745 [Gammaproteobacteria bacterium]|nr:hypothetical protein [Gammaproteobacteria bacterium]
MTFPYPNFDFILKVPNFGQKSLLFEEKKNAQGWTPRHTASDLSPKIVGALHLLIRMGVAANFAQSLI